MCGVKACLGGRACRNRGAVDVRTVDVGVMAVVVGACERDDEVVLAERLETAANLLLSSASTV